MSEVINERVSNYVSDSNDLVKVFQYNMNTGNLIVNYSKDPEQADNNVIECERVEKLFEGDPLELAENIFETDRVIFYESETEKLVRILKAANGKTYKTVLLGK